MRIEETRARSHSVENWISGSLWTFRKADYGMIYESLSHLPRGVEQFSDLLLHYIDPEDGRNKLSRNVVTIC